MKKFIIILIIFLSLFSCEEGPVNPEDLTPKYVVEAYLIAEKLTDTLKLNITQSINQAHDRKSGLADAIIEISSDSIKHYAHDIPAFSGYYRFQYPFFYYPYSRTYDLKIKVQDDLITASTTMPDSFHLKTVSAETLVYAQNPIHISWTESAGAAGYVISVICVDSTAEQIERKLVPPGTEEEEPPRVFTAVIDKTEIDIIWFFYNYYGKHVINIYAADVNFYDFARTIRQNSATLREPIYHIDGALGIFGSASMQSIKVFVKPNNK